MDPGTTPQSNKPPQIGFTLFELLKRIDSYIEAMNNKSTVLVACNVFLLGAVLFNWNAVTPAHVAGGAKTATLTFVVIYCASNLWSFIFTLLAVFPDLRSPASGKAASAIFFGDIASDSESAYRQKLQEFTEDKQREDLTLQIHTIAKALTAKSFKLRLAVGGTLVQLACLLIILCIKAFASM